MNSHCYLERQANEQNKLNQPTCFLAKADIKLSPKAEALSILNFTQLTILRTCVPHAWSTPAQMKN